MSKGEAAATEAEALRALADAHSAAVWRYVVHLTGDRVGADDVVQETLVRAWRSPAILAQPPETTRAWMFTVARHLVIDEVRSARKRHEITTDELPERAVRDRTDALFETLLIEEALAGIGIEHRAVIVHAYYGGRSIAEVARELGIPEGTVKSRLHYGLRALRLALQEKGVTR
ncbi:sigma-70 family RNA polymerase sigma factor [Lysinimonas soli]|uniref:Sigma-70 family RNA polymerase sigma factor n=1 Tax=Lysinimonas soli TaxID=1074233 RepID=A0ABW0NNG3_9MICO